MYDGQKTPRGYPDFHSYVKIKHVSYSRHLSGKHSFTLLSLPLQMDRITGRETHSVKLCWPVHSFCFHQRITPTSPVPSSKSICMCLIFTQKFLMAPTSFTMWSGWPSFKTNRSPFHTAEWIIFAVTGISVCSHCLKHFLQALYLMASSCWWKFLNCRLGRHFHPFPFFLDLDHCSKHLLQPSFSMASSCWWKVCHQQLGCHFHPFFLDLV